MPMLTHCCFSKNLRNGSIACGVWSLVTCVFSVGINSNDIDKTYNDPTWYSNTNYEDNTGILVFSWISLFVSLFTSISSILLFVAVFKNKAGLLIPWMVMVAIQIVFDAISIIFNILQHGFTKLLIAILLFWIVFTLINIYCELCVLSHYQELKIGRGRIEDYLGQGSVRYIPEVQHVHIGDSPINYTQSQHTVYSFHSQTLYKDEGKELSKPTQNGHANGVLPPSCNGRVLELRPIASLPANMDNRLGANSYTGSIEMKIVDSIPVVVDRRNLTSCTSGIEMASSAGRRPKRLRTVSESAVRPSSKGDKNTADATISSLTNIAEHGKELTASGILKKSSPPKISPLATSSSSGQDPETAPLTEHEANDEDD